MLDFSIISDNMVVKISASTIKNAIGHADPIGEQGTPGVSREDEGNITFHLNGTIKFEVG